VPGEALPEWRQMQGELMLHCRLVRRRPYGALLFSGRSLNARPHRR
jgi:hypothetical protein